MAEKHWHNLERALARAHCGRPQPEAPAFFTPRIMARVRLADLASESLWPSPAALRPALRFATGAGLAALSLVAYLALALPDLGGDLTRLVLGDPTGLAPFQLLWS